jgi:hypothetical protein
MELSTIIVNWNTRELVLQALGSLYAAPADLGMEVFVVDNGSSDGSVEAIRSAFGHAILVQNGRNLGFAAAANKAIRLARGRYLLLLNTDVILQRNTGKALLSFMEATPQAGASGAQLLNPDGTKQNSFDNFPTLLSEGLNKSLLRFIFPKRFPSKLLSFSSPVEVESVIGACMMVRREAIGEVGLLDEDYFFFMEETDWCYRMRQKGWKIYFVPQAQAIHLQGRTAERFKARTRIEYYRSRYLFFRKNRARLQVWILGVLLFLKLWVALLMNGILCFFTLFQVATTRRKLSLNWRLILWHLRFCPKEAGLNEFE